MAKLWTRYFQGISGMFSLFSLYLFVCVLFSYKILSLLRNSTQFIFYFPKLWQTDQKWSILNLTNVILRIYLQWILLLRASQYRCDNTFSWRLRNKVNIKDFAGLRWRLRRQNCSLHSPKLACSQAEVRVIKQCALQNHRFYTIAQHGSLIDLYLTPQAICIFSVDRGIGFLLFHSYPQTFCYNSM